jgi:hypothetical protein
VRTSSTVTALGWQSQPHTVAASTRSGWAEVTKLS